MIIAEAILRIITTVFGIIALVGVFFSVTSFAATTTLETNQMAAIRFAQSVAAAPCLVEDVDGEGRKGVFDKSKLSTLSNFCLNVNNYKIKITDLQTGWTKEIVSGATSSSAELPIAIKDGPDIHPGELYVEV